MSQDTISIPVDSAPDYDPNEREIQALMEAALNRRGLRLWTPDGDERWVVSIPFAVPFEEHGIMVVACPLTGERVALLGTDGFGCYQRVRRSDWERATEWLNKLGGAR